MAHTARRFSSGKMLCHYFTDRKECGLSSPESDPNMAGKQGNPLSRIFTDTFAYGVTAYMGIIASIILTPFYTRKLGPEIYGVLDIFNVWIGLATLVVPLSLRTGIIRFWSDIEDDGQKRSKYLGTIHFTTLMLTAVYLGGMLLVRDQWMQLFFERTDLTQEFYLALVIVCLQVFVTNLQSILVAQLERGKIVLVSSVAFLILSGLGFYLVYILDYGVSGFLFASAVSNCFSFLAYAAYTRRFLALSWDQKIAAEVLRYTVNFLSVVLLFQMTNLLDRYLIKTWFGMESVGVYSIALRIAGFLTLITGAFQKAWLPFALNAQKKDQDVKAVFSRIHNAVVMMLALLCFGIILFRQELLMIFAPDFTGADLLVPWLVIYYFVNGIGPIYAFGIHLSKKTQLLSKAGAVSFLLNVVSSILLLKVIGIQGIAAGTLISGLAWTYLRYYYGNRQFEVSYNLILPWAVMIGLTVISLLTIYPVNLPVAQLVLIKSLVFFSIGGIMAFRYKRTLYELVARK